MGERLGGDQQEVQIGFGDGRELNLGLVPQTVSGQLINERVFLRLNLRFSGFVIL